MLSVALENLQEWKLRAKLDKTERVWFSIKSRDDDVDVKSWKTSKSLGSLLQTESDINNRICQATAVMRSLFGL